MSLAYPKWILAAVLLVAVTAVSAQDNSRTQSEANEQSQKPRPLILVLDDCDPKFSGKETYEDNLSCINAEGQLAFRISGFNNCESIGSSHMIAPDSRRGWIWVLENVGHRIRKLDPEGKELLTIKDIEASAMAVHPETGNLWVTVTKGTIQGERTDVFDPQGHRLTTYPASGYDIAYDPKANAFWIAGPNLAKIDAATGKVLLAKQITTWCASSLDVYAKTGTVWVTVRRHEQVLGSANQLLAFHNDGAPIQTIELGEGTAEHPILPFCVSVDQTDGSVWVALYRRGLRRFSSDGTPQRELMMWTLAALADPSTHGAWVVTSQGVVHLNWDGTTVSQVDNKSATRQAWISAYR